MINILRYLIAQKKNEKKMKNPHFLIDILLAWGYIGFQDEVEPIRPSRCQRMGSQV